MCETITSSDCWKIEDFNNHSELNEYIDRMFDAMVYDNRETGALFILLLFMYQKENEL